MANDDNGYWYRLELKSRPKPEEEDELEALADGALRVLKGMEKALVYPQLGESPPTWNFKG